MVETPLTDGTNSYRMAFAVAEAGCEVSALLDDVPESPCVLVLAHGAGAGMNHPFMENIAARLAGSGIATLRYQFPYMERGRRAPDRAPVLKATVRAALAAASEWLPGKPVFAGGKSMGGRMTSLAAAEGELPGVQGLIFLGFPLHPAGRPSSARGEHLVTVSLPLLFLQGTRDKLAELELLQPLCRSIGGTLHIVEGADHSFRMLRSSGRTDDEVMAELAGVVAHWALLRAGAG